MNQLREEWGTLSRRLKSPFNLFRLVALAISRSDYWAIEI
jgi:hypothetical protein